MGKHTEPAGKKIRLSKINPNDTGKFQSEDEVASKVKANIERLYDLHYRMYAEDKHSLLIILHGIDTSGKDGTTRHIFAGANPLGCTAHSFKKPTHEELSHDFLWRVHRHCPERGSFAIFNRSHYEEVSVVKVHPEYLDFQKLPDDILRDKDIFKKRYEQINAFEKSLAENGTIIVKFLLHISKDEQKARLQERLDEHDKHWKFNLQDLEERKLWDKYMRVFEEMIEATNTKHAPWFVIPANEKWYRNYLVGKILVDALDDLKMTFPKIDATDIKIV